jgi:hypothetical protein
MAIAEAGHSLTQVSHPVHLLVSIIATNSFTPMYIFYKRQKKGFYPCMPEGRKTGVFGRPMNPGRSRLKKTIS